MNDAVKRMLQKYNTANQAETERALKEIIQEITLTGLWRGKFFEHAAFYGGTALRILYGLDRFSEDLDFILLDSKTKFDWGLFERNVKEELSSYGFEVIFSEKKKQTETAIQSAFLKTNTLKALLQIGVKGFNNPDALIRIKVEIDSKPIGGFDVESVYLREPLPVSIRALKESSLFAGKTHAALYRAWKNRIKGRDWYDLVWFLRRNIPLNHLYLEACMRFGGEYANDQAITENIVKNLLKTKIKEINLNDVKDDIRPFLRDPAQLDIWSVDFFHHWIDQLNFE
ncbi:MAG: nucleotidyl transferase AbiEii/AbiGii toxin family protein [Parachlamydiaceae bacterium]|nr:nucleotidyl transferase AbiEii/AbiGii toxin family protein [Parachlamydiaceae bacterium]